ncbi:MAG: nucleotidyltransferase domain-containing protein [Thalassotalea sp.]
MSLLLNILSKPEKLNSLSANQWQNLLSEANISQLTGRIYYLLTKNNIQAPEYVLWHLESAYKIAQKQRQQAIREFLEVTQALPRFKESLVFLKGAAYIAKQLPCSYGRTFSDIDVLVKKQDLPIIEQTLKFSDWLKTEVDDYDEKYYRTWMHEIPPLQHVKRGTVLDVHHNILPSTNKNSPDADKFNREQVEVEHVGLVNTLDDFDLVIHTAVHLFTESEFHHGLRDISDIDMLLRDFQNKYELQNIDYTAALIKRAKELGLYDYVRLAIRYSHLIFNTPLSNTDIKTLACENKVLGNFQDFCFINTFKPNHSLCRDWKMKLAKYLLYWRGHLIRMPLKLLIPHLTRKSWMALKDAFTKEKDPNENMIP